MVSSRLRALAISVLTHSLDVLWGERMRRSLQVAADGLVDLLVDFLAGGHGGRGGPASDAGDDKSGFVRLGSLLADWLRPFRQICGDQGELIQGCLQILDDFCR